MPNMNRPIKEIAQANANDSIISAFMLKVSPRVQETKWAEEAHKMLIKITLFGCRTKESSRILITITISKP